MKTCIFYPNSLREALNLKAHYPNSLFIAGGLCALQHSRSHEVVDAFICLKEIPEMHKVQVLPNLIELGSMISLQAIYEKGRKFFPSLLLQAIEAFSYYPVLGQATIGGNVCSKKRLDFLCVLALLDSSLEIKSPRKTNWIRLSSFLKSKKELLLGKNEILNRIRIPISRYWTKEVFKKVQVPFTHSPESNIIMCLLLRIDSQGIWQDSLFYFETEEETFTLTHKDLEFTTNFELPNLVAIQQALEHWRAILNERNLEPQNKNTLYNLMQWALLNLKN